jgi:lipopolysaccharide transport system ATP-binding protein
MNDDLLIKVEGVSKKFCKDLKKSLKYGFQDLGGALFAGKQERELRPDEFWAVKDISFEIRRGECLGLIGHNGAGKSTLLKMLNGLIKPDRGSIEMRGRVGALIELGAGFNPILTGRENIFNNAAVLGFSKQETIAKLDEIIAFAEIDEFLDMPVQNYSSGMKVRLGFAVAAQMQPDILLIDEVLAVGDMGFVLKCFNQMDKLLQNSALILVSHSMPHVSRMATKILMMDKGQELFYSDNVSDGLTQYYSRFKLEIGDYKGSDKVDFIGINLESNGKKFGKDDEIIIQYGAAMNIDIEIECKEDIEKPNIYLAFFDKEQRNFAEIMNFEDSVKLDFVRKGIISMRCKVDPINFAQGKYSISIGFSETVNGAREALFRYQSAIYFTVHGNTHGWAPIQLQSQWQLLK